MDEKMQKVRRACSMESPAGLTSPLHNYERLKEVRALALKLLAAHGLRKWTFAYNRSKRSMGSCTHQLKTIELSRHFVVRNSDEEILDTILHEIAHALVGPNHGHDRVWQKKCVEIGARPMPCGEANMPPGKWQAHCGECRRTFHRHRKPKTLGGWHCCRCGQERGQIVWQHAASISDREPRRSPVADARGS